MNSKRQRTAIRRCITTTIRQIEDCLYEGENDFDDEIVTKVNGLSNLLRAKQSLLLEVDMTILDECEEEGIDDEVDNANNYQTNVFVCLAKVEKAMARLRISTGSSREDLVGERSHASGSVSSHIPIPTASSVSRSTSRTVSPSRSTRDLSPRARAPAPVHRDPEVEFGANNGSTHTQQDVFSTPFRGQDGNDPRIYSREDDVHHQGRDFPMRRDLASIPSRGHDGNDAHIYSREDDVHHDHQGRDFPMRRDLATVVSPEIRRGGGERYPSDEIVQREHFSPILHANLPRLGVEPYNSAAEPLRNYRLPKLDMEPYDGSPHKYQSFMDSFESSVNSNHRLSGIDKFLYLRSLLKGRALSTIQGLSLTGENYVSALQLLKARFGDEKMLKATFFGAIHNLKEVTEECGVGKLRFLYDTIETNVRNLKSLGVTSEMFAPAIIPTILTKIPETIRRDVSKATRENDWDFEKVLQTIHDELVAREQCYMLVGSQQKKSDGGKRRTDRDPERVPVTSGSSLFGGNRNKNIKNIPANNSKCVFCGEDHKPWKCDRVVDVEKRRKILVDESRCFNCLAKNCKIDRCKSHFKCFKCKKKHHTSIHPVDKPEAEESVESPGETSVESSHFGGESQDDSDDCVVLLKTVVAPVSCDVSSPSVQSRLILDDGSQRSYITRALSEKLGLKAINEKQAIVKGICGKSTIVKSEVVKFFVRTVSGKRVKVKAGVLDTICDPISEPSTRATVKSYPHLRNIKFSDYHDGSDIAVDILIGGDYYYTFVNTTEEVRGPPGTPVAIRSTLGWTIGGPCPKTKRNVDVSNLATICSLRVSEKELNYSEEEENDNLQRFWDLDTVGIRESEKSVCEQFVDEIRYDGETKEYEVSLPFKPQRRNLPTNFNNAARRAQSEMSRLKRHEPETLRQYHEIIEEQLKSGKIERCPLNPPVPDSDTMNGRTDQIPESKSFTDFRPQNGSTHYLPHRGVKKESSETTKLRIVYDGSSKASRNEPSLNDCLYKGPSLIPLLFDVLLRFRLFLVGFVCDITKAFLQIRVAESDRDSLRFLWYEDPFDDNPELICYRFAYVLFGLNCSPFLLNATLRHHLMKYIGTHRDEILKILRSLYVDDFTGGTNTSDEAATLYRLLKETLREGGFPIHKFVTNDPLLQKLISDDCQKEVVKVLGVMWNRISDLIVVEFRTVVESIEIATKRVIAKIIMKIFDPLGLVTPVMLYPKLILQDAWRAKLQWDTPLPEEMQIRWRKWCESLRIAPNFEIPRCYISEKVANYQLIGFCDASTSAFAAVVYLRAEYVSGQISSRIIGSKARVAPTKIAPQKDDADENPTVPRLELLSCLILSTLMKTISDAFKDDITISDKQFWTDSTISLHRIRNVNTEYKQFVENRLTRIREHSEIAQWWYIPTDLNPADLPSRGCLAHELVMNGLWVHGPSLICVPAFDYGSFEQNIQSPAEVEGEDPELKSSKREKDTVLFNNETPGVCKPALSELIDIEKFQHLLKLLCVTSYVVRFVSRERETGELSHLEIESARKRWIIHEQQKEATARREEFAKTKANLRIYTDEEGIMRCRGRLSNSSLPYDTKFPVYIPRRSHLAELIVKEAHQNVFHQKERATLTEVRTNYWIPQCRKLVRRLLPRCSLCQRLESMAFSLPPPPPLPSYRVEIAPPFTNVGFDHMGPLWVYDIFNKDDVHKVYVALFTCATTRMIHLELQPTLEAPMCIRAMKRVFSRVGYPQRLVCDNHKTFRSQKLKNFATCNSIDWKHILELSPHWGGFYERLNRSIKGALRKTLWKSKLSYEEVETILIQIEGVLNSRPLCYVDDSDLTEPLTPSHLMFGRNIGRRNVLSTANTREVSPGTRVKHVAKLQEVFWKRFTSEYLTSLRERDHASRKRNGCSVKNLAVGDVVMIHQKHVARASWPLGKVERLVLSEDGNVRGAELLTEAGTIKRPANLLHPLEMS